MATGTQAYSYLRVSGKAQAADGRDGFPRQRATIRRYAKSHGIAIADEFADEGITGTVLDRPALKAMFAALAANGVRLVLVENPDRLFRDTLVGLMLCEEFRGLGVEVRAADSGTVLTVDGQANPTAKLIRTILAGVAEFEKTRLVIKLAVARAAKRRRTGRCEGRLPFGSYEGEPETLARIRELRRKPRGENRKSFAKVAATLQAEGRRTRQGGPWRPGTVYAILKRLGRGLGPMILAALSWIHHAGEWFSG